MLRKIRIVLALLFFTSITLLFLDFTGVIGRYLGWMAKLQLLPAILALNVTVMILILLLTVAFGRIYCSVICPLGVMQDGFAHIGSRFRKQHYRYHKPITWLRWTIFGLFVVTMIVGLNAIAAIIAPYSAYGRIVSNLLQPIYIWLNNTFATWAEAHNSYSFYSLPVKAISLATLITASATLVIVAALSLWRGRLWCNTICPVGTLLGFISRWSLFKPVIDRSKCINCNRCDRNCKAECINPETRLIDHSRCVACMNCLSKCKVGALHYRYLNPIKAAERSEDTANTVDTSRRKFIVTSAAVGSALALHAQEENIDGGLAVIEDKVLPKLTTPLKPAGSIGLRHFSKHCTSCQLCVAECPNHILHPSPDLKTFMQPEMNFHDGYCRPECTRCSHVCPTGAITPISPADKTSISIGHAVVVEQNCLSAKGNNCGHCAEVCPVDAIQMIPNTSTGYQLPSVDENRCLGCGKCEYLCPSRPLAAIYVEGREQHISNL